MNEGPSRNEKSGENENDENFQDFLNEFEAQFPFEPEQSPREEFDKDLVKVHRSIEKIGVESEVEEDASNTEGTPKEWRDKLREAIDEVEEKNGGMVESTLEFFESKKKRLDGRNSELNEEVKEYDPKIENMFRSLGETYNKLGWKSKLGIGAGLGLGAFAFSTVWMPAVFACMSGLAVQRVAGTASMFLRFEKNNKNENQSEQKKKEIALLKAGLYGIGTGLVISEAIHLAGESAWGEAMHEWLKNHWSFVQAPSTTIPQEEAVQTIHTPEPEMPQISVNASEGHGYEYMVKRLWEQLHDPTKHFALPPDTDSNSDIAKLFAADESSIDKVVHQIASDPNHHFFNADGTSVQINSTDHLAIAADGQIRITTPEYSNVITPEDAPVTSAYPSEAPAVSAPETLAPEAPVVQEVPVAPTIEKVIPVETPVAPVLETQSQTITAETPGTPTEAPVHTEPEVAQQSGEIIHRSIEGNNTISEFTLNDENLKGVTFRITIDENNSYQVDIVEGNLFDSQESINKHLTENWGQEIINKGGSLELGRGEVLNTARYLEMNERALTYLENNNLGNSDEANAIKSAIENTITMTEKTYGDVFNDSFGADSTMQVEPSTPSVEPPTVSNEELQNSTEESSTPAEASDTVATEVPVVRENIVVNSSGLEIHTDESSVYLDADSKHSLVYGGSPEDKMKVIEKFLSEYPDKTVYSADANGMHRIPWTLVDGKLTSGVPVQTRGLWGLFKSFMPPPGPGELKRLIIK